MTAREFLEYAGWKGNIDTGLTLLGWYVGKGSIYRSFPDVEVTTHWGESLSEFVDEPAGFQNYYMNYIEGGK